jgi:hypothetical protein
MGDALLAVVRRGPATNALPLQADNATNRHKRLDRRSGPMSVSQSWPLVASGVPDQSYDAGIEKTDVSCLIGDLAGLADSVRTSPSSP